MTSKFKILELIFEKYFLKYKFYILKGAFFKKNILENIFQNVQFTFQEIFSGMHFL